MCFPDPFYYWGFHIVRYPVLSEIKQWMMFYPVLSIAGLILIYLLGSSIYVAKTRTIEKGRVVRKNIIIACVVLVLAAIGTVVWMILAVFSCAYVEANYYTNTKFIEAVDESDVFYNMAIFYQKGLLDISETDYKFQCQNDACKKDIEILKNNTRIKVLEKTEGAFYKCKGSKVIHIVTVDDNIPRPNFYNDKSSIMSACTNG